MSAPSFEQLPDGVWPIREYPSLGVTLVECFHADEYRRERIVDGDVDNVRGLYMCAVCKAGPEGTDGWRLPVKLLAIVPRVETLF